MSPIATIKNEREFYRDFHALINVLKAVAISQFHALERKMHIDAEFTQTVESFFQLLAVTSVNHPFVRPREDAPLGIVAITTDGGLLGGLNHRIMAAAFSHMQDGSFKFQTAEFNDSLEEVKSLIGLLPRSPDRPDANFRSAADAVRWLNESVEPFLMFMNSLKIEELGSDAPDVVRRITAMLGVQQFEQLNAGQLKDLTGLPDGQWLKRIILHRLYPLKVSPNRQGTQNRLIIVGQQGQKFAHGLTAGSFEFQAGEFGDSVDEVKSLIKQLLRKFDQPIPELNSSGDAVRWLNQSIEPYLLFMNSMKADTLGGDAPGLIGKIIRLFEVEKFQQLTHVQLKDLAIHPEGQYLKRLILRQLSPQKVSKSVKLRFKGFDLGEDEDRYLRALELRDYVVEQVLTGRVGPVKVFYPFASSIQVQKVMEMDLVPCVKWPRGDGKKWNDPLEEDVLLESYPEDLVEYLVYLLMAKKFFEILQFSRLAEFAARTAHLEDSSEKLKEIDKKLQRKYFRARHEVIDQQMRELFTARSLYVE
jgi:F0F1-type ATP synthase gamma subunit